MKKLIILDFDGTFTDLDSEAAPFRVQYFENLATSFQVPLAKVMERVVAHEARIKANPEQFGKITVSGVVRAAATDPYVRLAPVTKCIADEFGMTLSEDEAYARAVACWSENYHRTVTCPMFKPHTAEVLQRIAEIGSSWFVTNSDTMHVQEKLRCLLAESAFPSLAGFIERTAGGAKKFIVDDTFDLVPPSLTIPGTDRTVRLRRPEYYAVLERLRSQHNVAWSDVTVVGDSFESDLTLPLVLGCKIVLVRGVYTPQHECDYVTECVNGDVISELLEVLPLLEQH